MTFLKELSGRQNSEIEHVQESESRRAGGRTAGEAPGTCGTAQYSSCPPLPHCGCEFISKCQTVDSFRR